MKIYKTQEEVEADIKDRVLAIEEDVRFEVSFAIDARIIVTGNISARDISARHINARDISARNINAWHIIAWDISAWDINAWNINAWNISAWNITFYAVAFACASFKCHSIVGERKNSKYFCLDREVEIMKQDEK